MRRAPLLALLAFAASSLLMYAFGDSGLTAYRSLSDYQRRLAANVTSLESNNRALQDELASLRSDPERIEVLARELGFYRPGDQVLRIEGMPERIEPYAVGSLLRLRAPSVHRGPWLKAAGIALVVLPVGVVAVLRRRRGLARPRERRRWGGRSRR